MVRAGPTCAAAESSHAGSCLRSCSERGLRCWQHAARRITFVWPPMERTLPPQVTIAWPAVGGMGGIGAGGGLTGSDDGGGAPDLAPVSTGTHSSFSRSRTQVSAKYRPPAGQGGGKTWGLGQGQELRQRNRIR